MQKRNKNDYVAKKKVIGFILGIFCLVIIVLLVGEKIVELSFKDDVINPVTASYISFNGVFDSDSIKISDLLVLSDSEGKKLTGKRVVKLNINSGHSEKKDIKYEVLLVPVDNSVDYKNISYYITDESDEGLKFERLDKVIDSEDGLSKILYTGVLKDAKDIDKLKIRLWINDKYKKKNYKSSFEVKVKLK